MSTLREAAQQALEALNSIDVGYRSPSGDPLEELSWPRGAHGQPPLRVLSLLAATDKSKRSRPWILQTIIAPPAGTL